MAAEAPGLLAVELGKGSHPGSGASRSSHDAVITIRSATTGSLGGGKGMNVSINDLRFSLPSNTERGKEAALLQGVHGFFEAGRMTALMGPSGSGKTTLLDILAGRKTSGTITGEIRFGGIQPTPAFLRRYTAYVEQFDTLIPSLTVFQMLMYTAELKRPRDEPYESKKASVEALISKLGLDSCRDVKIGNALSKGISGGQAKRVNIGIALISSPRVLFLDEPTSGLDSSTANEVMRVVRKIVDEMRITVVATIHSPTATAFNMFDSVTVLSRGHMVYSGDNKAGLDRFFSSVLPKDLLASQAATLEAGPPNRAELLIDTITEADRQGRAKDLADAFASSELGTSTNNEVLRRAASKHDLDDQQLKELHTNRATVTPTWWGILMLLKYRTATNFRDPAYVMPRIADKIFVGLLVLALYWQIGTKSDYANLNNQTAMLFMSVTLPAFGASSYMPSIVLERALFVRERNDGLYRVITYLVAKILDELLLALLTTLPVSCFIWFGVGLQGSYGVYWFVYFLTLAIGIVLAYLIASLAPSMDAANALLPTYVITLLYHGGLLITFAAMPVWLKWYSYIDFVKYGWGALMSNQFAESNPQWVGGQTVLEFFGFDGVEPWRYIGFEAIFFFVFFFAAWAVLSFRKYSTR